MGVARYNSHFALEQPNQFFGGTLYSRLCCQRNVSQQFQQILQIIMKISFIISSFQMRKESIKVGKDRESNSFRFPVLLDDLTGFQCYLNTKAAVPYRNSLYGHILTYFDMLYSPINYSAFQIYYLFLPPHRWILFLLFHPFHFPSICSAEECHVIRMRFNALPFFLPVFSASVQSCICIPNACKLHLYLCRCLFVLLARACLSNPYPE